MLIKESVLSSFTVRNVIMPMFQVAVWQLCTNVGISLNILKYSQMTCKHRSRMCCTGGWNVVVEMLIMVVKQLLAIVLSRIQ